MVAPYAGFSFSISPMSATRPTASTQSTRWIRRNGITVADRLLPNVRMASLRTKPSRCPLVSARKTRSSSVSVLNFLISAGLMPYQSSRCANDCRNASSRAGSRSIGICSKRRRIADVAAARTSRSDAIANESSIGIARVSPVSPTCLRIAAVLSSPRHLNSSVEQPRRANALFAAGSSWKLGMGCSRQRMPIAPELTGTHTDRQA